MSIWNRLFDRMARGKKRRAMIDEAKRDMDDLSQRERCPKCKSVNLDVQVGIGSVYCYCTNCGETIWQHIDEHLHDD